MTMLTFGQTIRNRRVDKKVGLREFAKKIEVSPAFLSKMERDEFNPPGVAKIARIAKFLELDKDELLALAGKIASDLPEIICKQPREMATFLRTVSHLTPDQIQTLSNEAERMKDGS